MMQPATCAASGRRCEPAARRHDDDPDRDKEAHLMMTAFALVMSLAAEPTVMLGTGPKMCAALTAADFKAVGLSPDAAPPRPPNSDAPTSAYCTYTKTFPVAGGLEFDIFDGEKDSPGVVKTIVAEGGKARPAGLAGVDESLLSESPGEKGGTMTTLVARHRRLVFAITIPSSPRANEQLAALAQLVLSRVKY
jgi:hypothetical protein